MEDCYYEGLADDVLLADDDLFQREVIKGDDALLLTDAFLSEVFRKYRVGRTNKSEKI